jgi:hypothetical protein
MRKLIILILGFFALVSCNELDAVPPGIKYFNLNNAIASERKPFSLDIDADGDSEFLFTTILTADGLGESRQFIITSAKASQVFEMAGRAGVLESGQEIAPGNPFEKNVQPLVTKRITNSGISWAGDWKDVRNKFIGIRFRLRDQDYRYGWIRVSFDQVSEELILHDFAFQTKVKNGIKAGDMP